MAANTTPIFVLTPNTAQSRISAANTARDGSGSLVTAFTAGSNGSRVESITFTSAQVIAAASSSMVVRVFVTDNAGANPRLLCEGALTGVTASNTAIGATITFDFNTGTVLPANTLLIGIRTPIILVSGQLIKVCQSVYAGAQDQNDVIIRGGDF